MFQCVRSDDSMIIEDYRNEIWRGADGQETRETSLKTSILLNKNPRRGRILGLEAGEQLPASGKIGPLRSKRDQFNLFKMGEKKPFAKIEFETEVNECRIVVQSLNPPQITAVSGNTKGNVTII